MPIPASVSPERPRILLRDEVHDRLRTAIVDGTLMPGERLRDEELSRWLRVSRTPIREALTRLARVGLVELEPNRFTRVSPLSEPELVQASEVLRLIVSGLFQSETSPWPRPHSAGRGAPAPGSEPVAHHLWALEEFLATARNPTLLAMFEELSPAVARGLRLGGSPVSARRYREALRRMHSHDRSEAGMRISAYIEMEETLLAPARGRIRAHGSTG